MGEPTTTSLLFPSGDDRGQSFTNVAPFGDNYVFALLLPRGQRQRSCLVFALRATACLPSGELLAPLFCFGPSFTPSGFALSLSPPFCPLGATIRPLFSPSGGNKPEGIQLCPPFLPRGQQSVAPLGQRSEPCMLFAVCNCAPKGTTTSLLFPSGDEQRAKLYERSLTTLSYLPLCFALPLWFASLWP